jgi:triacylglycerol lipase
MDYSKAIQCAILSREVYQDLSQLRFSQFPNLKPFPIDQANTDTQCAILLDRDAMYIVFRGSEKQLDWDTNLDFTQEVFEFKQEVIREQIVEDQEKIYPYAAKSRSGAKMHRGFTTAFLSVRDRIHEFIKNNPASRVTVTGHSLGGALATLCAVDLQFNFSDQFSIDIYTFGAPRVGNDGFTDSFDRRMPESYRFINGMDIVPALPRWWQGYRHVNKEYRLGKRFSLNFLSQRFADHKIDHYIDAMKQAAK